MLPPVADSRPAAGEDHHVVIEMFRKRRIHDPYAFDFASQSYGRRRLGAMFRRYAGVRWNRDLTADLDSLRGQPCDPEILSRLGHRLRALLDTTGWDQEEAGIQAALLRGQNVRITLCLAAAELHALPWELTPLEPSGVYLGQRPDVLFRYTWPGVSVSVPGYGAARGCDPRVLLAVARAGGAVAADSHRSAITEAYARSRYAFDPGSDVLLSTTRASLSRVLDSARDSGRPFTLLHLLCHGAAQNQVFGLALDSERAGRDSDVAHARDVAALLQPHAGHLRCVVLSACDSGNVGELGNHVGSVAQAVHRLGIPWVIGSRYPLSKRGSVRFAETFYDCLLERGVPDVEAAFVAARRALVVEPGNHDWASLQLYAAGAAPGLSAVPTAPRPAATPRSDVSLLPEQPAGLVVDPAVVPVLGARPPRRPRTPTYNPPVPGHTPEPVRAALRHLWSIRLTRWLVVLAIPAVLGLALYQLGAETHRSRLALIGVSGVELGYGVWQQMAQGVRVLISLVWYMLAGPVSGLGIEVWSIPILLGVTAGPAVFLWRGHGCAALVAVYGSLAVLGHGTVLYANAVGVHNLAVNDGAWPCAPADAARAATIPGQVRFEVCSWLRNDTPGTDKNDGRRVALGGLFGWHVVALVLLVLIARRVGRACIHDAHARGLPVWRRRLVGRVALAGVVIFLVLLLTHLPRVYAIAAFGLRYPRVTEVDPACDRRLHDLLAGKGGAEASDEPGVPAECNAVDISAGALREVLIIHGADCPGNGPKPQLFALIPGASSDGGVPPARCIRQTQGTELVVP